MSGKVRRHHTLEEIIELKHQFMRNMNASRVPEPMRNKRRYVSQEEACRRYESHAEGVERNPSRAGMTHGISKKRVSTAIEKCGQPMIVTKRFAGTRLTCVCRTRQF